MPFNLTPSWFRKLRRRKSSDDINAVGNDAPLTPERRGSSPTRVLDTMSPGSNHGTASPTRVHRGRFPMLTRRRPSQNRRRRGSSPSTRPRTPPPYPGFRPAPIRQVYFQNPPTPEASRVGLFPPPRPEPETAPSNASTGFVRKEHSFTREEINQLSKFPEPRSIGDSPPAVTKNHVNWKKFNKLQEQILQDAPRPNLGVPIAGSSDQLPTSTRLGLDDSSNQFVIGDSIETDLCSTDRRLEGTSQDVQLSPLGRRLFNELLLEVQKQPKDEYDEYEDIDDYKMQHPIRDHPQLPSRTEHFTTLVSDLVTQNEEQEVAKLTKKSLKVTKSLYNLKHDNSLKVTKSLHNLKHDNSVDVHEVNASFVRRMDEEKSPMPKRKLSSGEYFTDASYFRHLGAKVPPDIYCGINDKSVQKVRVKTNGEYYDEEEKRLAFEEAKRLENDVSAKIEKNKDKSAKSSTNPARKNDESIQKAETKKSGGHSLVNQKYVSSEDFRRLNNTVFPIPKSESSLDRVMADARTFQRAKEAAGVLLKPKNTGLQRKYANALAGAEDKKPPVPAKDPARAHGTKVTALERAHEGSTSVFTKNLLTMQPKNANAFALAKEENTPVLTRHVTDAYRTDENALGRAQEERILLQEQDMAEVRQNTNEYRRQLYRDNSLLFGSGMFQPTEQVMQLPVRREVGLEFPSGQRAQFPTIRKMKSEAYALARNDPLAKPQRAVHTPPLQAMPFGRVNEQGATSVRPRQRVMFEGDSSAETSSRPEAAPQDTTASTGSSSRADNSDSGSVSITQTLPSAVRFPPQVFGGSHRVLMPDNGRLELAYVSPAYIHPHPLPSHQHPFVTPADMRMRELRQNNLLRYESVGPRIRGYGQVDRQDERAGNGVAESMRSDVSCTGGSRGKKGKEVKIVEVDEADEAAEEYYRNRCDPTHRSTIVMPSTSLDEERSHPEINDDGNRMSLLNRHRQELQDLGLLPERPRPTLTFEIEEPRPVTPPNWMETLATTFGRPTGMTARERARISFPFSRRPASLAARPRLLLPAATHYANLARIQREISRNVFFCCALCPPIWLVYGYGGLDWYMRWESHGQLDQMSQDLKDRAVPLGWVYGLLTVALVTLLCVYLSSLSA